MKQKSLSPAEKLSLVEENDLCFNCLRSGHRIQSCKSPNSCFKSDCSKKHHTTLHDSFSKQSDTSINQDNTSGGVKKVAGGMSTYSNEVYLQIVPVQIADANGKMVKTYALLDTGSQSTLVRDDLAVQLQLKGVKKNIKMSIIKDNRENIKVQEVDLNISSTTCNNEFETKQAFVIPKEKFNIPCQNYFGLCDDLYICIVYIAPTSSTREKRIN